MADQAAADSEGLRILLGEKEAQDDSLGIIPLPIIVGTQEDYLVNALPNQAWQPTPEVRPVCFLSLLARRDSPLGDFERAYDPCPDCSLHRRISARLG